MRLRVPLLRVDEVRELGGVSQEENGCVVENPVPVAFLSTELDCKSTWVASCICRSAFTTDGRDTGGCAAFVANL